MSLDDDVLITDALARLVGESADEVNAAYHSFVDWALTEGKDGDPLSSSYVENMLNRLDQSHRRVLTHFEPDDSTRITPTQADDLLRLLEDDEIRQQSGDPYAPGAKRKFKDALVKYQQWRYETGPLPEEWTPATTFSDDRGAQTEATTFSLEELGRLLEAAETYKSLPSYYDSSPEQQDQIDALVAQRLSKPKDEVTVEDRMEADFSSKVYSLVVVGFDAGLAPKEIQNATKEWFKPQRQLFVIPTQHATKERENEVVALSDRACEALSQWIQERRHLENYDGRTELWLTREETTYKSGTLCHLLRQVCDEAGITREADDPIRWYSLRRTMAAHTKTQGSLEEANDQLRHSRLETTQEDYPNTVPKQRQSTLNKTHEHAMTAANDPEYDPYDESMQRRGMYMGRHHENREPDESITRVDENSVHVDAVIQDSPEEKAELTEQVWSHSSDE